MDPTSLERIVPDELCAKEATGAETLQLHIERYQLACSHLVPGSVLDMACGVGYGTALLGQCATVSDTTGVDVSEEAVQYARRRYGSDRISFICSDASTFSPKQPFDNIISLETIEHVDDPAALFSHLVSLLKPGGRLIASVPITPSVDANPHHKNNFSAKRFRRMGETHSLALVDTLIQVQRFNPFSVALRKEARTANLRRGLIRFYMEDPSHLVLRVWSMLRDGFVNKYMTVVWQK